MPAFCRRFGRGPGAVNSLISERLLGAPVPRLDRLGVVVGEFRGDRKFPGFQVVDAAPAFDPGGGFFLALDVEGEGEHAVGAEAEPAGYPARSVSSLRLRSEPR